MFHVLVNTILPIFSIIILGYFLKRRKTIDAAFARTANQIVFNVAIPAMLLNEIVQAPFKENFDLTAVLCTLGALGLVLFASLFCIRILGIPDGRRATFLQSSFHGNIGYMAYAVAYFALGEGHFARMAIMSSFLMVGQNLLAVWALVTFGRGSSPKEHGWTFVRQVIQNPIIPTVAAGIIYSALGFNLPPPVKKGLEILSGMAFPTALLLIGAGLSFGSFHLVAKEIVGIGVLKLAFLPLAGYVLMTAAHVPDPLILPAIILLASPPATITYVMAIELGGDPELAATSVSVFTLGSAFTYSAVLAIFA